MPGEKKKRRGETREKRVGKNPIVGGKGKKSRHACGKRSLRGSDRGPPWGRCWIQWSFTPGRTKVGEEPRAWTNPGDPRSKEFIQILKKKVKKLDSGDGTRKKLAK